jgi:hypothetical protein
MTYNTALFGGMVAVGLLFIAYAVGLHVGKGNAAAELPGRRRGSPSVGAEARVRPGLRRRSAAASSSGPEGVHDPAGRVEAGHRAGPLKALALAEDQDLKKALERAGHRGFEKQGIKRGTEERLALYVGRYTDLNSDAAKSALTAMKTFRWKNQTPFAQAVFEEAQPK